jgi:hypothetical protein
MKRTLIISVGLLLAFATASVAQTAPGPAPVSGAQTAVGPNFVDANGDGICDRFQSGQFQGVRQGQGRRNGNGTRPRPQNGTRLGPGPSAGGGTCDGTGPKGRTARRGNR